MAIKGTLAEIDVASLVELFDRCGGLHSVEIRQIGYAMIMWPPPGAPDGMAYETHYGAT